MKEITFIVFGEEIKFRIENDVYLMKFENDDKWRKCYRYQFESVKLAASKEL